jgi:hypothetical protein
MNMPIFTIWHFHDITEGPKEKSLQERDSCGTL